MSTAPRISTRVTVAIIALSTALVTGCGGGGGASGTVALPAEAGPDRRLQSLILAKGLMDTLRSANMLSRDVQNIIVLAPVDMPAAETTNRCGGGGTLTTRTLRPASSPLGGAVSKRFDKCSESGVLLDGTVEVAFTRTVTESASQPWAGSVRFENYVISSTGRQRSYQGLATAEGEVRGQNGSQPMTMRLTDFRMRDTPDALGAGPEFSSTQFDLARIGTQSLDTLYRMGGTWTLRGGPLAALLAIDAGSTLSLLENTGTERLAATAQWQDASLAPFAARVTVLPVARYGLSLALDLNQDGVADQTYTFDRNTDIGLSL